MAKILIVGCGAIGTELGVALSDIGHQVTGLRRYTEKLPESISVFPADITQSEQLHTLGRDFDIVFFIVSPEQRSAEAYQRIYETGLENVLAHFAGLDKPPHWFFVSSTSVYGQEQGEWVDEHSITEPKHVTSQFIRAAEIKLMLAAHSNHTVIRFSGIYGPGRDWLIRKTQQTPIIQKEPPYYTNRIHQQDCIGILLFLLNIHVNNISLDPCYLASDDNPASQWEVISWLASQLYVKQPEAKSETAGATQNKRCSNKRIKDLGYSFKFPDYRSGYQMILHNR